MPTVATASSPPPSTPPTSSTRSSPGTQGLAAARPGPHGDWPRRLRGLCWHTRRPAAVGPGEGPVATPRRLGLHHRRPVHHGLLGPHVLGPPLPRHAQRRPLRRAPGQFSPPGRLPGPLLRPRHRRPPHGLGRRQPLRPHQPPAALRHGRAAARLRHAHGHAATGRGRRHACLRLPRLWPDLPRRPRALLLRHPLQPQGLHRRQRARLCRILLRRLYLRHQPPQAGQPGAGLHHGAV